MRKSTKIWLIIAIIHIVIGAGIFTCVMTANNWNFKKLTTLKYETNTYEHIGEIKNIIIETTTADIDIQCAVLSTQYTYVECYETEKVQHTVSFEDGNLVIRMVDNRKWYDYVDINFDTPKITIGLSSQYFDAVNICTTTGDVDAKMLWGKEIDISVTTGDIQLEDTRCDNLTITGSTGDTELTNLRAEKNICVESNTGDITLTDVIAKELDIECDTGDVKFNDSDAAMISVEVDTGDVTGTLLTGKIFEISSDTGKIDVPENGPGGKCEIETDTGDIKISVIDQ